MVQKIDKPDLVHVNTLFPIGIGAVFLKWKHKIPYIISEHWTDYQLPMCQKISWFHKRLAKIIVRHVKTVAPVSYHFA